MQIHTCCSSINCSSSIAHASGRIGRSAEEAKRMLAPVLANGIFDIAKTKSEYDQARYLSRLRRLPDMS